MAALVNCYNINNTKKPNSCFLFHFTAGKEIGFRLNVKLPAPLNTNNRRKP